MWKGKTTHMSRYERGGKGEDEGGMGMGFLCSDLMPGLSLLRPSSCSKIDAVESPQGPYRPLFVLMCDDYSC